MSHILLSTNDNREEKSYWETRAGKDAGTVYKYSNIAWLAIGLAADPSYQMALAGLLNFTGSKLREKYSGEEIFGNKNFGDKAGALFGVAANLTITWQGLLTGDPLAIASNIIIGTAAFFDIKSGRYRAKYENHESPLLRETLGQSRRLVGLIRGASRIPLIALCVATGNIPMAAVAVGLLAADTIYAFSKPQKEFGKDVSSHASVAAQAVTAPAHVEAEPVVYPLMPTRELVRARRISMQGVRRALHHSRIHARILPPAVFRRAERALRPSSANALRAMGKAMPRRDYA